MERSGRRRESRQKKITDAYFSARLLDKKIDDPDWALTELYLCREVYHCRPSELGEEDAETVLFHIELINVERKVEKFKAKPATGSAQGKVITMGSA